MRCHSIVASATFIVLLSQLFHPLSDHDGRDQSVDMGTGCKTAAGVTAAGVVSTGRGAVAACATAVLATIIGAARVAAGALGPPVAFIRLTVAAAGATAVGAALAAPCDANVL